MQDKRAADVEEVQSCIGPTRQFRGDNALAPNLAKLMRVCRDIGVEIVPVNARQPGAGQTTARSTLERILLNNGEGHLIQLLRTFVETENNGGARIDEFSLYAISYLMLAHSAWADSGLKWFEVFDRIDLGEIQRVAKGES